MPHGLTIRFLHRSILNEFQNKTLIVITHKTENLAVMDKIYHIKDHTI